MEDHRRAGFGPQLDMTPDGQFVPRRAGVPWTVRIGIGAALVALVAIGVAGAALAFWIVAALLPVVVIAGAIAWIAFRIQLWRARRSVGGSRDLYRP